MPAPPVSPAQWADTAEACRALACGPTTLRQLRERNVLKPGQHWRRVGARGLGGLRWDLASCERTLRELAAQEAGR